MRCELKALIDWNSVLTDEFPLAPKDLMEKGLVKKKEYGDQNRSLAGFVHRTMKTELLRLNRPGRIEVLGFGLGRDLGWIPSVIRHLGYRVAITDGSAVACANARQRLRHWRLLRRVEMRHLCVEEAWETGQIDEAEVVAYYGGQFIQVQDLDTMWAMLAHLGAFLALPGRAIYLLHARGEDNDSEEVRWGKSTPYFEDDLRAPLEEGLSGQVKIHVVEQHMYFHQKYSLLRIRAA